MGNGITLKNRSSLASGPGLQLQKVVHCSQTMSPPLALEQRTPKQDGRKTVDASHSHDKVSFQLWGDIILEHYLGASTRRAHWA
jgi:hypothetical protein